MSHDFAGKHGGKNGPCNGGGFMSYGTHKNQWSSCSKSDFRHHYSSKLWGRGCLDDISRKILIKYSFNLSGVLLRRSFFIMLNKKYLHLGPCTKDTCLNGGTCTELSGGGFSCQCLPGISGNQCQNNPGRLFKIMS